MSQNDNSIFCSFLLERIRNLLTRADFESAVHLLHRCLASRQNGNDLSETSHFFYEYVVVLRNITDIMTCMGLRREAKLKLLPLLHEVYRQVKGLKTEEQISPLAPCLHVVGLCYFNLNSYRLAVESFQNCIARITGCGAAYASQCYIYAVCLSSMGKSYEKTFQFDKAIDVYLKGLDIAQSTAVWPSETMKQSEIAKLTTRLNHVKKYKRLPLEAFSAKMRTFHSLISNHEIQAAVSMSKCAFSMPEPAILNTDEKTVIALAFKDIVNVLSEHMDGAVAISLLDRSMSFLADYFQIREKSVDWSRSLFQRLSRSKPDKLSVESLLTDDDVVDVLLDISLSYYALSEYQSSLTVLKKAMSLSIKVHRHEASRFHAYGLCYYNIGLVCKHAGELMKSESAYMESIEAFHTATDWPSSDMKEAFIARTKYTFNLPFKNSDKLLREFHESLRNFHDLLENDKTTDASEIFTRLLSIAPKISNDGHRYIVAYILHGLSVEISAKVFFSKTVRTSSLELCVSLLEGLPNSLEKLLFLAKICSTYRDFAMSMLQQGHTKNVKLIAIKQMWKIVAISRRIAVEDKSIKINQLTNCMCCICECYNETKQYRLSINHNLKAIYKIENDHSDEDISRSTLGRCYYNLGISYERTCLFEQARESYDKAIEMFQVSTDWSSAKMKQSEITKTLKRLEDLKVLVAEKREEDIRLDVFLSKQKVFQQNIQDSNVTGALGMIDAFLSSVAVKQKTKFFNQRWITASALLTMGKLLCQKSEYYSNARALLSGALSLLEGVEDSNNKLKSFHGCCQLLCLITNGNNKHGINKESTSLDMIQLQNIYQQMTTTKVEDNRIKAKLLASCKYSIGSYHMTLSDYGSCIETSLEAISIMDGAYADKAKKYKVYGLCYQNMGAVYDSARKWIKAQNAYIQALKAYNAASDWVGDEKELFINQAKSGLQTAKDNSLGFDLSKMFNY